MSRRKTKMALPSDTFGWYPRSHDKISPMNNSDRWSTAHPVLQYLSRKVYDFDAFQLGVSKQPRAQPGLGTSHNSTWPEPGFCLGCRQTQAFCKNLGQPIPSQGCHQWAKEPGLGPAQRRAAAHQWL